MIDHEEHLDALMELVSSHYWRAVKKEIEHIQTGLISQITTPITSLDQVFAKEGNASRLAALREFVREVEKKAENRAKQVRNK